MKKDDYKSRMTPEEKELLRRLMETPGVEKEWDFFEGMSSNTPPPEFFMRGKPEPRFKRTRKVLAVCGCIVLFLTCSTILATFMVPDQASADKTPFEMLVSNIKNGFLQVQPDSEGIEEAAVETVIEDEEEAKIVGRRIIPQLLLPEYLPNDYMFYKLKISQSANGVNVARLIYKEKNGDNSLKIEEFYEYEDVGSAFNVDVTAGIQGDEESRLFQYDGVSNKNILTIWFKDGARVVISGEVEEEVLTKVFEELK